MDPTTPTDLPAFLSYAHSDLTLVRSLRKLLVPRLAIGKARAIFVWNDEEILAGEPWRYEIDHAMERSDLALLAISPNFFHSKFIREIELKALLNRTDKVVVPFTLDDVSFAHHALLGVDEMQVFQFLAPEWSERRSFRRTPPNRRADWVNRLVDEVHSRYAKRSAAAA
jgi:hypothetical protein